MLHVTLFTSSTMLFEGESRSVLLPGELGWFEIGPFHKPLLSRLVSGDAVIDGRHFPIKHGVVKVKKNEVTIMVEPEK